MKKILPIFLLTFFSLTTFAQFKMGAYTAGIDSYTDTTTVKDLLFRAGGTAVVTKDGKPFKSVSTKKHKLKVIDQRLKIKKGTPGRIVEIVEIGFDTTIKVKKPNGPINGTSKKVHVVLQKFYMVRFDNADSTVIPFTAGKNPASDNLFNPYLSVIAALGGTANAFGYNGHLYQLEGSITLQLPKKQIDKLREASGFKF